MTDLECARALMREAEDACGLYHTGIVGKIAAALAAAREEAVADLQKTLHLVYTREKTMVDHERQRWMDCALVDATMEGPKLRGWNRSALDRMWKGSTDG